MIEETQALYPDLRMCSFDRGFHSRNNRKQFRPTRRQARVESATRQGTTRRAARERQKPRSSRPLRRQHPAVESAINSLEHRGLETGPHPRHPRASRRLRCRCWPWKNAPPGAAPATAGAGRQETTRRQRRLPANGVAHTSGVEPPAPRGDGTAPFGRVPKIGAEVHHHMTPPRPIADIFLDEIGLQLARKVWWIVTRKASDRGVFWQTLLKTNCLS